MPHCRNTRAHKFRKMRNRAEVCEICDRPLAPIEVKPPDPLARTIDHIIPRMWGGTDAPDNLRVVHFLCNNKRGGGHSEMIMYWRRRARLAEAALKHWRPEPE